MGGQGKGGGKGGYFHAPDGAPRAGRWPGRRVLAASLPRKHESCQPPRPPKCSNLPEAR